MHFPSPFVTPQQPLDCFLVIYFSFLEVGSVLSLGGLISCWTLFLALSAWFLRETICFCMDYICISYYLLSLSVYYCWFAVFLDLFWIPKTIGLMVVIKSDNISPLFSPLASWLNFWVAYLISTLTWSGLWS